MVRYFCDACGEDVTATEHRKMRVQRVTVDATAAEREVEETTDLLCLSCFGRVDDAISDALAPLDEVQP